MENAPVSSPSHRFSVIRVVMSEASTEQEVFYEDLINLPTQPERPTTDLKGNGTVVKASAAGVSASAKVPVQENAASNTLKRQRTLVDMLGPSTKKTKLDGSSTAVVLKSQMLNSIPFNLNGFINSLTEEQRDLLGLEIEAMGKSWSVSASSSLPRNAVQYYLGSFAPIFHSPPAINLPYTAQVKAPTRRDQETLLHFLEEIPPRARCQGLQ